MVQLLFFIILQAPKLELPQVTIYGERERVEVIKESLLPDSVSPLPAINEYIPKAVKLRARDIVYRKDYTARLWAEAGSSGRIRIYTGFNQYSLFTLYEKDVVGLKERVELNLGLPYVRVFYGNVSFKGGKRLLGKRYSGAGLKFSFVRRHLFVNGGIARSVLSQDKDNSITFNATYDMTHLDVTNKTKFYINEDFISSFSVRFPLYINNFILSPGMFAALSNRKNLSRVYPMLSVMSFFSNFALSLSYSPYTSILDRNELLAINPFCNETHYRSNTGSLFELALNSEYGRIKVGYQENYPVFCYDTTAYSIKDTSIYFIEARTEWSGFTLDAEYRHNVSDYMPYLSVSPGVMLKWREVDCSLSSPIVFRRDPAGSYIIPTVSLLYTVFRNLSLIFDIRTPFGETERWKGCDKEPKRLYLGIALNL
jgi:hypothetical protein